MGLFDAFSADDETRKFEQGLNYRTGKTAMADNRIDSNFELARGDLRQGAQQGIGYLQDARDDINQAQTAGQNYLTGGVAQAAGIYDQALAPWQQLSGLGTQGVQSHYNLLQNPDSIYDSELYKSREAAGLDALNRGANARGMLASGNNTQDQIDYMRQGGLDYFNTLMNQHHPYFGMAQNAAQGQANVLGQKAGMYDQLGRSQAGLSQWGGGALAGNNVGMAGIETGLGTQLAGNRQTQGLQTAENSMTLGAAGQDTYGNIANAGNNADAMGWNALLGLTSGIGGGLSSYVGAGGRFT
jgi:hypothetical protein